MTVRSFQDADRILREHSDVFDELAHPEKFRAWLFENFHVLQGFQRYAFELRTRGNRSHYGINAVMERLRWDSYLSEHDSEYKLNNNYAPFLSRIIMIGNPALDGMFLTRGRNHD